MDSILTQIAVDEQFNKGHLSKMIQRIREGVSIEDRVLIDLEIIDLWNKVKPQDLELVSNDEGAGE